jgi:hypothetical protein
VVRPRRPLSTNTFASRRNARSHTLGNLTLTGLGLVEPEKTDHAEPEDILTSVVEKERRILEIVEEMRELVTAEEK